MNTPIYNCYWKVAILVLIVYSFPPQLNTIHAQVANVTIETPAPHGGNLGMVSGGLAFQSRTRNTEKGWFPDGNIGSSFGLGDSKKYVGILTGINIFGLSNSYGEDGNFGSGTMDLQINKNINDYIFVGIGARNLLKWKSPSPAPRNNRSFYAVGNFIIPIHRRYDEPFSLFFITAGIGNGMFRPDKDFTVTTSGKMYPFGSLALQVLRGTNIIMEWNGYQLSTGVSVYPFRKIPALGGTFAITDLTETYQRFLASIGFSFNLNDLVKKGTFTKP